MDTRLLKWLAIVSPAALVALVEYIRHTPQVLGILPMSVTNWVAAGAALVMSYIYFQIVFALLDRSQALVQRKQQELAILKERERIARDLHDGICQALFFTNVKLMEAEKHLREGQVESCAAALGEGRAGVRSVHEDVRRVIFDIKTVKGLNGDFNTMVRQYVEEFHKQTGLEVRLEDTALRGLKLDPEREANLLSIIQEALWNVRKHSRASVAEVSFLPTAEGVELRIKDNGQGFVSQPRPENGVPHFGLSIMKERAALIGASMRIDSGRDKGTEVVLTLPHNTLLQHG